LTARLPHVKGVVVGEFRSKKLVLDAFLLFSTYRLILVGIGRGGGNGIVDGGL
jgi:hypothetical protein